MSDRIVHIKKHVKDRAKGKMRKRTRKSEAVSSSTRTDPIAYKTALCRVHQMFSRVSIIEAIVLNVPPKTK